MFRGTRMIVITKNKILAFLGVLFLFCLCTAAIKLLPRTQTSPAYKSILKSEITPAEKTEAKKEKPSVSTQILKHFFALGDFEPQKAEAHATPSPTPTAAAPVLTSESRTIDKGLKVSNATEFNVNPKDFLDKKLNFTLSPSDVQVLVMHTHTTESFSEESYQKGAPDRNLDEAKNMIAIGKTVCDILKKNGINAVHDATVHDYPSYNGAYQRAAATISKNLNQYPTIKVVLDIHRDGITREDGTKVKLVTDINGEKAAQIMLVVGTNANLTHDNWHENFTFASKIQAKAIEMYPSLMRPIDLRKERFNEQLTPGSLIVEVGSNGNTQDEAKRGAAAIAEVISKVLSAN